MGHVRNNLRDFDSFYELIDYFHNEEVCIDYLASLRWDDEPVCPYCENKGAYVIRVSNRPKRWKCKSCKKQFSVRIGTIFEGSKISLRKWFFAIYLITSNKKGISSHQLARHLKLTQKSAWFLTQRVRHAFKEDEDFEFDFDQEVEVDEAYIGGKEKNKHWDKRTRNAQGRSTKTKAAVLGIIARGGKVFAIPVANTQGETILPIIQEKVPFGARIYSDEWTPYKQLAIDYRHSQVSHGDGQYVLDEAHTNSIESYWATVKRTIGGTYHKVDQRHLHRYVDECSFRFNHRNISEGDRFDVLLKNSQGRLTWKDLTDGKEKIKKT